MANMREYQRDNLVDDFELGGVHGDRTRQAPQHYQPDRQHDFNSAVASPTPHPAPAPARLTVPAFTQLLSHRHFTPRDRPRPQADLYGLGVDGRVYKYRFGTEVWRRVPNALEPTESD